MFRVFLSSPDLYVKDGLEEKEQPVASPLWWSRNGIMINDCSRAGQNIGWMKEKDVYSG